jgi:hypothetical protein
MDDHGIRLDTERIVQKLALEFRPDDGQTEAIPAQKSGSGKFAGIDTDKRACIHEWSHLLKADLLVPIHSRGCRDRP